MRFALALLFIAACRFEFDAQARDGSVGHDTGPVIDSARDAYFDLVMSDAPVAYWRLGDHAEVAKDELANHDAVFSGGITEGQTGAVVSSSNTATAFNGMDGEAQTTTGISFPNMQTFTIEVWANETNATTYWHFLTCEPRVLGMPQQGYALLQAGSGVMFERIPNPGQYDQTGTAVLTVGKWTHIAGVYDGTNITLYIDGVARQMAPAPEPAQDFESPVFLGAHVEGAYFGGTLDEAAIYDHALTAAQLKQHVTVATTSGG